jgi:hypothetical protein
MRKLYFPELILAENHDILELFYEKFRREAGPHGAWRILFCYFCGHVHMAYMRHDFICGDWGVGDSGLGNRDCTISCTEAANWTPPRWTGGNHDF